MPRYRFYSLVLACLATLLVASWGLLDALEVKDQARRTWQGYMAETATSDASQLETWLATFANQTQRLASDPRIRHLLASDANTPGIGEVLGNAKRALVEFNVLFGAKFIYLFNADNSASITLDGSPKLATDTLTAMATSFEAHRPTYQPLIRGAGIGYLGTALPVTPQNAAPLGYVMAVYNLDGALERLGAPAALDKGANRYLVRLDHQGRPQALKWPRDSMPLDPIALAKTKAQWPQEASRLSAPFPAKTPFVDIDGTPVYAWMSEPQVDGHWATVVTAPAELIYKNVPHTLLMLGLRTALCIVCVWIMAFALMWWLRKNPLKGQGDAAMRAVLQPVQRWLKRPRKAKVKKQPAPVMVLSREASPLLAEEEELFQGKGSQYYAPPPPLRVIDWDSEIPPTPERMADFVKDSLQHERIKLYYQPIIDLATEKPVMFETLMRLADEKNRLVMPPDFLPAAKQFDLLPDIDDKVLSASIRKHQQLQSHGKLFTLSINLSETAFRNEKFMQQFNEGVANKTINTAHLVFEVSSTALLQDSSAMTFIHQLQDMGCRFAIDYFGGGAKGVAAVDSLKFNYMKVNALRFADIETNAESLKQFREVIEAAERASLDVIVEKVETQLMYRLCKRLGVPYAQGFFIAPPEAKIAIS